MDNDVRTEPIHRGSHSRCPNANKLIRSNGPVRIRRGRPRVLNPQAAMEDVMQFRPGQLKVEGEPDWPMDFLELVQTHGSAVTQMKTKNGMTPLHYACAKGWGEYAELLVARGSDVGATNVDGCRPLWFAVNAGCKRCVRAVWGDGLGDPTALPMKGYLSISVSSNNEERVSKLLVAGAGVGAWEQDGSSALYIAAINGYMGMIQMLVEAGVIPEVTTVDEASVIETARKFGHDEIVLWLTKRFSEGVASAEVHVGCGDDATDAANASGPAVQ